MKDIIVNYKAVIPNGKYMDVITLPCADNLANAAVLASATVEEYRTEDQRDILDRIADTIKELICAVSGFSEKTVRVETDTIRMQDHVSEQ